MTNKSNKILVVDDEPDNSLIFSMALEDNGFVVDRFTDPQLALSSFKADAYDLLLIDIKMPKMNGFELYREIRKMDNKVKVCFLTAFGEGYSNEFKKQFPNSIAVTTAADFIRKPIAIDDLVKKIKSKLE
jgi:DNA-binding response OmpR family regulator